MPSASPSRRFQPLLVKRPCARQIALLVKYQRDFADGDGALADLAEPLIDRQLLLADAQGSIHAIELVGITGAVTCSSIVLVSRSVLRGDKLYRKRGAAGQPSRQDRRLLRGGPLRAFA